MEKPGGLWQMPGLMHQEEKGLFATGLTRFTGLTKWAGFAALKNPVHPVIKAMIDYHFCPGFSWLLNLYFSDPMPNDSPTLPPDGGAVAAQVPVLGRSLVFEMLGNPKRRKIVEALADGEPHRVKELAGAANCPGPLSSAYVKQLREAGMIVKRNGLYRLPKVFLPRPGEVDFGHCVLRLPQKG